MATNDDDTRNAQLYEDLKGFLQADRTDLRRAATDAVTQVQDLRGMEQVVRHGLVPLLAKNASYDDDEVSLNALKALVYLSSHGASANQCIEDLLEESRAIQRMLEIALSVKETRKLWRQKMNYACSLLANMTRTEKGAVEFVGRSLPDEALKEVPPHDDTTNSTQPTLQLLLSRFLNTDYIEKVDYENLREEQLDSDESDPYQHVAAILMNATQIETGRAFVLKMHYVSKDDAGTTVFQSLLPQLKALNPLRRRGIAGMIRNCCLDHDYAFWMLHVVNITSHLLFPLAGPEALDIEEKRGLDPDLWLLGPDKKRETDHYTRLFLVESLFLLGGSGRKSRAQMQRERVPVILKLLDMVEEQEDVTARVEQCMQYLEQESTNDNEDEDEKLFRGLEPSAAKTVGANFDDVD